MESIRRWYIYLSSLVSLNVVTWAIISLLRMLFGKTTLRWDLEFVVLQISVIIIGLPVYIGHWLWAQRLAAKDKDESGSIVRRLYLYAIMAGTLGPILANVYDLITPGSYYNYYQSNNALANIIAILVLSAVFYYHQRTLAGEVSSHPESGGRGIVRRGYVLGYSLAGLTITSTAVYRLVRWVMFVIGSSSTTIGSKVGIWPELARLLLGMAIWVIFWRWAQQLFAGPSREERQSSMRKFYLYTIVFITALSTVGAATSILYGFFRKLLDLKSLGDIRDPITLIISAGVFWAYHAYVLRGDEEKDMEASRQSWVRRLYYYLVAGIGLAVLLGGLVGAVNLLFTWIDSSTGFGDGLKDGAAIAASAILAGLPMWSLPWRIVQGEAVEESESAASHRRSTVRKVYLYLFLFGATMAALFSLIFIVTELLLMAIGELGSDALLPDMAAPMSFALIASGVLAYHGSVLRKDGGMARTDQAKQIADTRLVVVDGGDGKFGQALLDALKAKFPGLQLSAVGLTGPAGEQMGSELKGKAAVKLVKDAGLIVGPWTMGSIGEGVSSDLTAAVVSSKALKLAAPLPQAGWELAGVDEWGQDELVARVVKAVDQILAGETVTRSRGIGCGGIAGFVVGGVLLMMVLFSVLDFIY